MPVRMTHPDHGITFAVGAEVDWNKAHGWKVAEKNAAPVAPAVPVEDQDTVGLSGDLRQRYIARFGVAPHHRMKPATIERALME